MGLPEYFCSVEPAPAGKGTETLSFHPVLVVAAEEADAGPALGHQYLLGVIPFTNLYLAHGLDTLLEETLLDLLLQQSFAPVVVYEKDFEDALGLIPAAFAVKPEAAALALNAYDALFFRILNLSGTLALTVLQQGAEAPVREVAELDSRKYRSYGYAPELASLLVQNTKDGWEQMLPKVAAGAEQRRRLRRMLREDHLKGAVPATGVLVPLPTVAAAIEEKLSGEVTSSYGFKDAFPIKRQALARIVQRGMAAGFRSMDVPVFSLVMKAEPGSSFCKSADAACWRLSSSISSLTIVQNKGESKLRGEVLLMLEDLASEDRVAREIKKSICRFERPVEKTRDGYYVFALEEAFSAVAVAFFSQESGGIACAELP